MFRKVQQNAYIEKDEQSDYIIQSSAGNLVYIPCLIYYLIYLLMI